VGGVVQFRRQAGWRSEAVNREQLLQNAKRHCFFIGVNDSGAALCKSNSVYGIAAIHYIQSQLKVRPSATFISTPDVTITRNENRWKSGFGYGGKISWGAGDSELIILNTKPNACGMLVGGLENLPDIETLIKKLHDMDVTTTKMDGIEVMWDFSKSNHFIDLFEVVPVAKMDVSLPPCAFVIHGAAGEFSGDNESGFGMYYDKSELLRQMAERVETPFGNLHVLVKSAAKAYFEKYKYVENRNL
jgi:hypothetical protein